MNKILLISMAALGLTMSAHANIGDTRNDAVRRYGDPISTNSNGQTIYQKNGWRVVQAYNPRGYCYQVTYVKMDSTAINGAECTEIDQANRLPGGRCNQSFISATATFTTQECWTDPISGLALTSGSQLIGNSWCFFRAVTNTRNSDGGQERINADDLATINDVPM